MKGSFVHHFKS